VLASAAFLLALPACGGEGTDGPRTVQVLIEHSRFQPTEMTFEPGTTVTFVVRNTDPIDHEFILGDRAVQDRHENGTEPHHGTVPGEVSIAAGQEATTTYRFTAPGTLIFGCHLPGHYAYGMRGVVVVG
jgi:uncharacterized cupredoxin-like copper-binding protein